MSSKILIADDSLRIRALMRSSIENHHPDWTVCGEAENGKLAVAMADTLRPHLVILDLSMPIMNGLDAAREISAMFPGIPMIMFTLYESDRLREEARRVGVRYVFSKADGFGKPVLEAIQAMLAA